MPKVSKILNGFILVLPTLCAVYVVWAFLNKHPASVVYGEAAMLLAIAVNFKFGKHRRVGEDWAAVNLILLVLFVAQVFLLFLDTSMHYGEWGWRDKP